MRGCQNSPRLMQGWCRIFLMLVQESCFKLVRHLHDGLHYSALGPGTGMG